jgi:hypothetical protein
MCRAFAALLGVTAAASAVPASGQWLARSPLGIVQETATPTGSLLTPTLLSLALPGAGQHALRQDRKWVYLALEVAGWALWVERRASAADYRTRYRDFAWERGRIQSGPRMDGDFDYYERLSKWTRSGAFDADPSSSGVQPELDVSTYNGSIWALASGIFFPPGPLPAPGEPAYQSALAYYQDRAYGAALLWDWTSVPADRQELGRLITESDNRFGHATTVLGAVIANHLLSAADAYLSARGRVGQARIRVLPAQGLAPGWALVLSLGVGE